MQMSRAEPFDVTRHMYSESITNGLNHCLTSGERFGRISASYLFSLMCRQLGDQAISTVALGCHASTVASVVYLRSGHDDACESSCREVAQGALIVTIA